MQLKKLSLILFLAMLPLAGHEGRIRAFFSEDQLAERLIEAIDQECKSVKVAVCVITHLGIADALIRAKARGVAVEVIVDPLAIKNRGTMRRLIEGKVPVFVWEKGVLMGQEGKRKGLMHDKFCVLGRSRVWTGSLDFTYDAASRHRESALLVEDRKVAEQYLAQFSKIQLSESRPYREFITLYPEKKRR